MSMTSINEKAFTLVELLVIIAILLILLALLMPGLRNGHKAVLKIVCQNNLRQLHITASAYMDQANGALPVPSLWGPDFSIGAAFGTNHLTRFSNAEWEEIFPFAVSACPTIPFPSFWMPPPSPGTWQPGRWRPMRYLSPLSSLYLDKAYPSGGGYARLADTSRQMARVGLPRASISGLTIRDRVPLFADPIYYYSPANYAHIAHTGGGEDTLGADKLGFLPPEGQNSLWLDGHAEWHDWPAGVFTFAQALSAIKLYSNTASYRPEGWTYVGTGANAIFCWGRDL